LASKIFSGLASEQRIKNLLKGVKKELGETTVLEHFVNLPFCQLNQTEDQWPVIISRPMVK